MLLPVLRCDRRTGNGTNVEFNYWRLETLTAHCSVYLSHATVNTTFAAVTAFSILVDTALAIAPTVMGNSLNRSSLPQSKRLWFYRDNNQRMNQTTKMAYQKANIHYLLDKALSCHQYHVHHRRTQRKRELAIVLEKRKNGRIHRDVTKYLALNNYNRQPLFLVLHKTPPPLTAGTTIDASSAKAVISPLALRNKFLRPIINVLSVLRFHGIFHCLYGHRNPSA